MWDIFYIVHSYNALYVGMWVRWQLEKQMLDEVQQRASVQARLGEEQREHAKTEEDARALRLQYCVCTVCDICAWAVGCILFRLA